jgi:mannosyltransferase OCH1-like enzyme
MPDKYLVNVTRVKEANPGWKHMVWDDDGLRRVCRECGWEDAYDACRHMHQKIDLGRYVVLYVMGGISIDADVSPLKPLDALWTANQLPHDRVIVSKAPLNNLEASIMSLRTVPWWLNNATIICPQKRLSGQRKLCVSMARRLTHPPLIPYIFGTPMIQINWTTGPTYFTTTFLDKISTSEYAVLESTYFEPCVGYDNDCTIDSQTSILNHHHDGTWHSSKTFIQSYYFLKNRALDLSLIVVCIICINFVSRFRE